MPLPAWCVWKSPSPSCTCMAAGIFFLTMILICPAVVQADSAFSDTTAIDTAAVETEDTAATPQEEANPRICITLDKGGKIVIELYPDAAPMAVERILQLVEEGFYDGLRFHRVESYLIQTGKKETELPCLVGEMFGQSIKHEEGMVGMARLVDDYDSATTQFYICKKPLHRFNCEYTLIGKVVEGLELVHKIKKGRKIDHMALVE